MAKVGFDPRYAVGSLEFVSNLIEASQRRAQVAGDLLGASNAQFPDGTIVYAHPRVTRSGTMRDDSMMDNLLGGLTEKERAH